MPAVVNTTEPQVICIPANIEQAKSVTAHRQKRVAAYCRVSTDQEEQLTSYEAQCAYYTEKIMTNPEWTLAGIFADEGITGTSTKKRERFKKMISLCRRSKIDMVLTKSISRFARNTVDCLAYIRELKELGIPVIFEKENINTMTTDSEIVITMLGGFAQAESESISQNVRWGLRQSFKQGKVTFQYKRMYGYERGEDKQPRVIPEQAAVVRRVFEAYRQQNQYPDDDIEIYAGLPTEIGHHGYKRVKRQHRRPNHSRDKQRRYFQHGAEGNIHLVERQFLSQHIAPGEMHHVSGKIFGDIGADIDIRNITKWNLCLADEVKRQPPCGCGKVNHPHIADRQNGHQQNRQGRVL